MNESKDHISCEICTVSFNILFALLVFEIAKDGWHKVELFQNVYYLKLFIISV